MKFKTDLPPGFDKPDALPGDRETGVTWQQQNRKWWQNNPMRYDWGNGLEVEEFSAAFYQKIDQRFFEESFNFLPWKTKPFDQLIPFSELKNYDVLEIGVGNGSHAQLLATASRSFTGIDLTEYAVESVTKRFAHFKIPGSIRQMDAEKMDFPDNAFDFVWSWGVIHHSSNTADILKEIHRVLRPGAVATIMVYHRSFLYTYVVNGFLRGIVCGEFFKGRSLHEIIQLHTDGAIARFYRINEWVKLAKSCGFDVEAVQINGQKSEVIPIPPGRIKQSITAFLPNALSRLILNTFRQGSFLISVLKKRDV